MDAEACRISEDVYYCAIHLPSHIKWLLQIQPSSNDGIILQKLISHHFLSSSPWFCTLSFPLGNCSLDIAVHHRGWLVGVDLQHCHVYIRDSHGWLSYPIQSRHSWYTVFSISHPVSQASTSFLIPAYIPEASGAAFYRPAKKQQLPSQLQLSGHLTFLSRHSNKSPLPLLSFIPKPLSCSTASLSNSPLGFQMATKRLFVFTHTTTEIWISFMAEFLPSILCFGDTPCAANSAYWQTQDSTNWSIYLTHNSKIIENAHGKTSSKPTSCTIFFPTDPF